MCSKNGQIKFYVAQFFFFEQITCVFINVERPENIHLETRGTKPPTL